MKCSVDGKVKVQDVLDEINDKNFVVVYSASERDNLDKDIYKGCMIAGDGLYYVHEHTNVWTRL